MGKKKREEFNDLLIPILLVLCIMPLIVRFAEYSCGYGKYLWYSSDDGIIDLYHYYRCYFFEVVAVFTLAVLAFRMALYKEKTKSCKIFIPAAVYGVMALISTFFSVNMKASWTGNFYQFQSMIVIAGYLILCFYTYQILEREADYKILYRGVIIIFIVLTMIGAFQIAKKDLLNYTWMQRLIMPKEAFNIYGGTMDTVFTGNNVFLTLYNPNYAGVFLTMTAAVFGVMCYSEKIRKNRIFYGILFLCNLILVWFTYSRSTLVSLLIALSAFLMLEKGKLSKILKYLVPSLCILAVAFVMVDKSQDFHYLSRLADEKRDASLEEMLTTGDGIWITYAGTEYMAAMEHEKPVIYTKDGKQAETERRKNGEVILHAKDDIRMFVSKGGKSSYLNMYISNQTFTFGKDKGGYFYLTENGKKDELIKIKKADFGGLEYWGSGRMYIWSRVLPILKNYILVGSGPDTFAEVFPQNDYVGKAIYADTPARIMERPHNDYLLQWVQTGFLGCVAMLTFYVLFLKRGLHFYKKKDLKDFKIRFGYGCFLGCICYMAGSMFNDSTLYTASVFWIFAGTALAAAHQGKQ